MINEEKTNTQLLDTGHWLSQLYNMRQIEQKIYKNRQKRRIFSHGMILNLCIFKIKMQYFQQNIIFEIHFLF